MTAGEPAADAADPTSVRRHERQTAGVACGAHALHDGYTDVIFVLLPLWQREFGIGYAELGMLRGIYAGTMATFQIGDDAQTFDEMRDKIDRRAAAAEARMQLGSASVDSQMQEIEKEAMDMQLQDKLLEYKRQMGLLPGGTESGQPQALPAQGETTPQP